MTWFILLSGKGIGCENGRCLYIHEGFWYVRDDNSGPRQVVTDYAMAMLDALGFTWTGTAITRKGAKATPALVLEPVDIFQPPTPGLYLVKYAGRMPFATHLCAGDMLCRDLQLAARLPEEWQ